MADPHPRRVQPELSTVVPVPEHSEYAVRLKQTDLERPAAITAARERPSIVLGADREDVLAKTHQWIAAHATCKHSP